MCTWADSNMLIQCVPTLKSRMKESSLIYPMEIFIARMGSTVHNLQWKTVVPRVVAFVSASFLFRTKTAETEV